jgi:predicted RNase H-like nuclease
MDLSTRNMGILWILWMKHGDFIDLLSGKQSENGPVEIVDLPIKMGGFSSSLGKRLPEGKH